MYVGLQDMEAVDLEVFEGIFKGIASSSLPETSPMQSCVSDIYQSALLPKPDILPRFRRVIAGVLPDQSLGQIPVASSPSQYYLFFRI